MTTPSIEYLFRQAAKAEGGMSVSAGARVAHVHLALQSGRAITIDLSEVPEDRCSSLVAVICELVRLTAERSSQPDVKPISASPLKSAPDT